MVRKSKSQKKIEGIIVSLKDQENAFISIILMGKGRIVGTELKRIFLEKYSYWELQKTEQVLLEKGLVLKWDKIDTEGVMEYFIPKDYNSILSKVFISKPQRSSHKEQLQSISIPPCGDYSILWYLMHADLIGGKRMFSSKPWVSLYQTSEKRIQELLKINRESVRFLIDILKGLSDNNSFAENGYEKWSDLLNSPHKAVKDIFKMVYDSLRESRELGRDDVGKDNMEFFFEELAALKIERWYPLSKFVKDARSTLFSCRQPYRWIHFDEENLWNILNTRLKIMGIVEIATNKDQERFFSPTILGGYLLDEISGRKIEKIMSSRSGMFMAHPNFEVTLVSKEVSPKALLKLAMFSRPTKLDTVSVFNISKESVRDGMGFGLSPEKMISHLRENCKGKVPQNVEYSINDWGN
jgi:hypothetical protein